MLMFFIFPTYIKQMKKKSTLPSSFDKHECDMFVRKAGVLAQFHNDVSWRETTRFGLELITCGWQ